MARGARVIVGARTVRSVDDAIETRSVDAVDAGAVVAFFAGLPRVDHIYIAAGSFVGGPADGDVEAYRAALEPRVFAIAHVVRATRGLIPPGGSITLTGGVSTDRPAKSAWITNVGTAAAEQSARALALDLAPVRENAVAPGWTDTPMWDPLLGEGKSAQFAAVAATLPIGRIAAASEVADAVLFLMNNRAVTGEVVHVDGGGRLV